MAPIDKIHCLACKKKGDKLEDWEYEADALGPEDIEIRVTHNGLCHSDLHVMAEDWGPCQYPFVPGHEIIGVVEQVGKAVTDLKKGDRVGYGWFKACCMNCDNCVVGKDNVCPKAAGTIMGGSRGGFAEKFRAMGALAVKIPEEMSSQDAAPLLCAGVTVWSPNHRYVTAGTKVGVVGLGGLGHLALQFAAKLGAEVTAISGTSSKEKEARGFGAHHFMSIDKVPEKSLDVILNTAPGGIDPKKLVNAIGYDGTLVYLGGGTDELKGVLAFDLILAQRSITGSAVGGRRDMRNMVKIAGLHDVKQMVEVFPLAKVNDALEHLKSGKARYRIVLETGDYQQQEVSASPRSDAVPTESIVTFPNLSTDHMFASMTNADATDMMQVLQHKLIVSCMRIMHDMS